eukprot:scaffold673424_cov47-Prasinocladus_malaysianus.AAC.1
MHPDEAPPNRDLSSSGLRENGRFLAVFVQLMARHLRSLSIWEFLDFGVTLRAVELIWDEALLFGMWQEAETPGSGPRYVLALDEWYAILGHHVSCRIAK